MQTMEDDCENVNLNKIKIAQATRSCLLRPKVGDAFTFMCRQTMRNDCAKLDLSACDKHLECSSPSPEQILEWSEKRHVERLGRKKQNIRQPRTHVEFDSLPLHRAESSSPPRTH